MSDFQLRRLGLLMEPEPGNPLEAEGVLNPAVVRGPDGQLYLFPRLVARGNYSRIGIARVRFNEAGDPVGVERLGIALEPEAEYERRPDGSGGCEDPRITFVEPLRRYVMTYTAHSATARGSPWHYPRICSTGGVWASRPSAPIRASSSTAWTTKTPVFPVAIPDPSGQLAMAILHRPLFPGTRPEETALRACVRRGGSPARKYLGFLLLVRDGDCGPLAPLPTSTRITGLAAPVAPWEQLKIGGGAPPVLTRHGWLIVYHGVSERSHARRGTQAVLLGRGDGTVGGATARHSLSFARAGADAGTAAGTRGDRRQRRISRPASTAATTSAHPTVSTCITGWPTTGSA